VWRWSKRIAVVLSLLMFGAAVWMWVRSYWVGEEVIRTQIQMVNAAPEKIRSRDHYLFIRSSRGRLRVATFESDGLQPGQISSHQEQMYREAHGQWLWGQYPPDWLDLPKGLQRRVEYHAFGYGSSERWGLIYGAVLGPNGRSVERVVTVPWGAVAGALAIAPAWWAWKMSRRRRRFKRGLCRNCGYDIRATAATCPECGTAVG